jgi:tetratricopeptide (TPR) repeat protein
MPRDALDQEPVAGDEDDPTWRDPPVAPPPTATAPAPVRLELHAGDVLSDRFVVEAFAGSGGMGTIHRAKDLLTGQAVAIKVMASEGRGDESRFAQEVSLLAELSHPAIVRYVGHGATALGTPFLAMDWLDGEDLAARLARAPLTAAESIAVMRRACEGVAVAHAIGVVHRDLKPSNLFLVGHEPAELKVLDFGIARHGDAARTVTQPGTLPGTLLGTVGYMSPEQAMGPGEVDARADVFALGCVLFECLTGRAAFVGSHAVAVLAKVLREDPPPVSELRPELGKSFDALVGRLLEKNPEQRLRDAAAVLSALDQLGREETDAILASRPTPGLTGTEQRIVSVILGRPRKKARSSGVRRARTELEMGRIEELARRFGAEPVPMRGGGLLVVLSGRGAATDQATQAATCALLLQPLRPDLCLVVATGRAETAERIPVGAAIDRAARLLSGATDPRKGVALDELTAGLIEPGFDLRKSGDRIWLIGQHVDLEATRLLMGKPTPFMGREKELGLLELTLSQCVDDSVTRAVLVTGPPGQGKSRLRHEFVARVRERTNVNIVTARADPVGAGSAFAIVRQLVRGAMGLREGDATDEQRARLDAHVSDVCKGENSERIADFLSELIGVSSTRRASPELRAARNDPQIMGVWLRRSFREWLEAESTIHPILLLLEDLHWGDLPSVGFLGEALQAPSMKSLMVLALARPEVHHAFPGLWEGADKLEVPLGRLTPRAAEGLVRGALGAKVEASAVSRIVARADGNAFYLEELIRRVAEGDTERFPETVLALVQTRLERLESDARRIVRAASVFGEVFWAGGVAAVLGATRSPRDVAFAIQGLVKLEVFAANHESRFPGEGEYRFRHDLLREGAYAMLTDADRTTGHLLAGKWLERAGEKDPLALADHFDRGNERARAIPWLLQAAQSALDGGNVTAAIALARRGIDCDPDAEERGRLRLLEATALGTRGDWPACVRASRDVMNCLPVGSAPWFGGAGLSLFAGMSLGDPGVSAEVLQAILSVPDQPEPSGQYGFALYCVCVALVSMGQDELADAFVLRAEAAEQQASDLDPRYVLYLRVARGHLRSAKGQMGQALESLAEAREVAESTNDFGRAAAGLHSLQLFIELGQTARVEAIQRELSQLWKSTGLGLYAGWSTYMSAWSELNAQRPSDAVRALRSLLDRDAFMAPTARAWLAHALVATGELDDAEREARTSLDAAAMLPAARSTASVALALVNLMRGRPAEALAFIESAPDAGWPSNRSTRGLARAEALHAVGRTDDARRAIRDARDRILRIAAGLEDAALQHSFTTIIAANARTLALAREWLE